MFRVLRAEDPVHWHPEPQGKGFWCVTRHADVVAVNRNPTLFSSERNGVSLQDMGDRVGIGAMDSRGQMMLMTDPPKHTRYRRLVSKGFTPRMIGLIERHLEYRAELIVDSVIEKGSCDFVTDLAAELPLQAIAEIMGVPQSDRHLLFEWSNQLIGVDDPEYGGEGLREDASNAALELYLYSNQLAKLRAADPKDDIVTLLINAEIDGDRLSEAEFDMFMLLLAVAGNETTRNATAHGMLALLEHPEQWANLKADPDAWMETAIEEILRWGTPVMHFRRTATADTTIAERAVAEGDKVVMWHISANRDETVFADPFVFDIGREPNPHIAFGGGGAHFCLGANLARAELQIIFREIIERLPEISLAGPPERLRSNFIGGIKHLPVEFPIGSRHHPAGALVA